MDSIPATVVSMTHSISKEDSLLSPSQIPSPRPTAQINKLWDNVRNSIYRFEVTYGLYVMDFWEKMVVYGLLFSILAFSMWMVVMPLVNYGLNVLLRHFAFEPKGLHTVLEQNNAEYVTFFAGNSIQSNITALTVRAT
ncbi:hypothetical protein K490DRAFT_65851 [Saccharata proteae CBS 121410]|uniref:Uncharacterized protein n=1 Tax=Saccharata proteae CBS 121410 TaxID=1314787 RepID=A0A9P4LXC2_9PEZI|nr:hypothetical protein K490DRAFT_65851 [Saccharata proteae CBS 121410]